MNEISPIPEQLAALPGPAERLKWLGAHRLLGPVGLLVERGLVGADLAALARSLTRAKAAVGTGQIAEERRVFEGFVAGGVRTLALKGCLVAYACYPSPDQRWRADLDVLVAPDAVDAAREVLRVLGYRPMWSVAGGTPMDQESWLFGQGVDRRVVESLDLVADLGELVLIVHPAFLPVSTSESHPLNDYVAHRQEGGWSVSLVDITDIQLQYGGGMPLPNAVNNFLAAAISASDVSHVLLVGGDSFDYRDHYGLGSLSFIPTHYAGTSFVAHTPSDARLADLDDDGLSDLALGRWPVRTLDDLRATVQKVFDWEENLAADRSAVWLTDENDPRVQAFANQAERMFGILLDAGWSDQDIDRIFFEDIAAAGGTPELARQQLFRALENGRTLTGFSGHGSPTLWSFQGILTSGDVADLGNEGLPTLVGTAACYTSYFASPFSHTLAHRLMNGLKIDSSGVAVAATNGAVAVHGAATLSSFLQNEVFMRSVLEGLIAADTLGEAIQQARVHAADRRMHDLVTNWTLLGDPTLRLSGKGNRR